MNGPDRVGREPREGLRPPKDLIHRAEHIRPGAERMAEAHVAKLALDGAGQRVKRPMHGLEFTRGCALEGEDRLFLVADREDRPLDEARAGAGKKFSAEA